MGRGIDRDFQQVLVGEQRRDVERGVGERAFDAADLRAVEHHVGLPVDAVEIQPHAVVGRPAAPVGRQAEADPVAEGRVEIGVADIQLVVAEIRIGEHVVVEIARKHGSRHRGGNPGAGIVGLGQAGQQPAGVEIDARADGTGFYGFAKLFVLRQPFDVACGQPAHHFHLRQHIGLAVDRFVEQEPDPAAAAAHFQIVTAHRLGAADLGHIAPRGGVFAHLQHPGSRGVEPVEPHFAEAGVGAAQVDRDPLPAAGGAHPRAMEVLRRKHWQQLPLAVEKPGLPVDGGSARHFDGKAVAVGFHLCASSFPFAGEGTALIGPGKLAQRPPFFSVKELDFSDIGRFFAAFRQLRRQAHSDLVHFLFEPVQPYGKLLAGTFRPHRRPRARIENEVVLALRQRHAVVAADLHPGGGGRLDDAVDGQLGRDVVVDGAGVVGGSQMG